jgi:anti-sigma factor RsiW
MRLGNRISDAELHAYADSQLSEARAAEVAKWLDDHPADDQRVSWWRMQNEAIQRAFPQPAREKILVSARPADRPAPAAPSIATYRTRQRRRRALVTTFAFASGAVAASFVAMMAHRLASQPAPEQAIPVEIVRANSDLARSAIAAWTTYARERVRPVEMGAKDAQGLASWIAERTGLSPLPQAQGLRLVGGRILPGRTGPAAFLLYETSDGERLALLAEREVGIEPSQADRDGVRAIGWRSRGHDFAVAASLADGRLKSIAEALSGNAARP